ncbi:MAG: GNAT family N-acetyltransferase [Halarsenatibacteraceae bacterium]
MNWSIKSFAELDKGELYEILKLRVDVFVVEQECPYPELDGKDERAYHLIGRKEGQIIAYSRLFLPGEYFEEAAIGRVIVKEEHRNQDIGTEMLKRSIKFLLEEKAVKDIKLSAQNHLRNFYENQGFEPVSEVYLEDGIPHIDMLRRYS